MAAVRREFAAGLGERLGSMRQALTVLAGGYDPGMGELFYLKAHALKGTAAAFGAAEVAGHAARLADLGRRWMERRQVAPEESDEAGTELDRLGAAMERYQATIAAPDGGTVRSRRRRRAPAPRSSR